jgi:meiotic recombination protein DMC1
MCNKKQLLDIKGISEAKLDKIIESAMKIENAGFMTGNELRERRKQILKITTGSPAFDEMLGGGMES